VPTTLHEQVVFERNCVLAHAIQTAARCGRLRRRPPVFLPAMTLVSLASPAEAAFRCSSPGAPRRKRRPFHDPEFRSMRDDGSRASPDLRGTGPRRAAAVHQRAARPRLSAVGPRPLTEADIARWVGALRVSTTAGVCPGSHRAGAVIRSRASRASLFPTARRGASDVLARCAVDCRVLRHQRACKQRARALLNRRARTASAFEAFENTGRGSSGPAKAGHTGD